MLKDWLNESLAAGDRSQVDVSRKLSEVLGRSIDRSAVNKMTLGLRKISGDELLALGKILDVPIPDAEREIPVKGFVGAGGQAFFEEMGGDDNERMDIAEKVRDAVADKINLMSKAVRLP